MNRVRGESACVMMIPGQTFIRPSVLVQQGQEGCKDEEEPKRRERRVMRGHVGGC